MTTQVQIRGTSQATQESRTLASRELDVNTTDKRICIHDGSTAGGLPHANYIDVQNNEYTYALATGTNAIAITLAKAPASYQAGQIFWAKLANDTTSSATLNVNGLGAKSIVDEGGNAVNDLKGGAIYGFAYDGTNMRVLSKKSGCDKLVYSYSITGSPSTLDFTSIFQVDKIYNIVLSNVRISAVANIGMRFSENNGSTWVSSTAYYFAITGYSTAGAADASGALNSSFLLCSSVGTANSSADIKINFSLPNDGFTRCTIDFDATYFATTNLVTLKGGGIYVGSAKINAAQIILNTGTFSSGEVRIYEKDM